MVYIRRIDLRGFKTFGKKVSLTLDRGLTVVTGPNGSGKSNVIDSVKFALGELSAKELRGGTITDLIHRGSPHVTARSAYVAIQFDNADRRIPVDADAVTISREFRKDGEGIYRLNGRRISRKQLTDILSSADIQVSGHNIVQQHAITRLAEVTLEERRKIIEDMIGIAVYDAKKAEAELQLQQADLNIKVASARTDEVRSRVEGLEKERNDYLRSQQLKKETSRLQAKIASHKIAELQTKIAELRQEVSKKQQTIEQIRAKKDEVSKERERIESERSHYEERVVEKGSAELFNIERTVGDVNARIAGLKAEIESSNKTIRSLELQEAELKKNLTQIDQSIEQSKSDLATCKTRLSELMEALGAKRKEHDALSQSLAESRKKLGEESGEADAIEEQIAELTKQLIELDAEAKGRGSKIAVLEGHIQTLKSRRNEFEDLARGIKSRMEELAKLLEDEKARLRTIEAHLAEYANVEAEKEVEVVRAAEVSKKARLTLAEVETQRSVAEVLASEDSALELIEEMGRSGAIAGVYGRLSDLMRFKEEHRRAVEAASAGWMRSIVVKNIDSAIGCIESLKRTKLGRVKLIPIENLYSTSKVEASTQIEGVLGTLEGFIEPLGPFDRAINFVFGDTILTATQRSAFMVSLEGHRAVSLAGDLYEPGGGMEIGYYREPLDARKLLPKQSTLADVESAVASLENLLERSKKDLERLREETLNLTESRATSKNLIEAMQRETDTIGQDSERTARAIENSDKRIRELGAETEEDNAALKASLEARQDLQNNLDLLVKQRSSFGLKAKSTELVELESRHAELYDELNKLIQDKLEVESRISTLESSIATFNQGCHQMKTQAASIEKQALDAQSRIEAANQALSTEEEALKQLQDQRQELLNRLTLAKTKRAEFDQGLKRLESELMKIINQLEPLNREVADLNSAIKENEMRASLHWSEVKQLGYNELVGVDPRELPSLEESLAALKRELERIGAVNELAVSQYEDQKNNYKQLATRIYEIEKERHAIVEFMNELDKKKHDMFMRAFNQVNSTFQEIFTKITGTGKGRMVLEFPEDPFRGGVDVLLEFPGKSEMAISSASGGEKSVSTVCFLLALQAIHPMPFYIFDEIDAHLDVVNSQRLAELLLERSKGSQFVVVSLKDTAISRANRVYGVFIQDGVSQIVSMPMAEVTA
ncbi:chromosome segregation protein SMC [[Eubacterium] cellulosolvens]